MKKFSKTKKKKVLKKREVKLTIMFEGSGDLWRWDEYDEYDE